MGVRSNFSSTQEPLFLMDGTAFLYRCFYANPGMKRADGFPTGAIFSLGRILLRILKQEKPTGFVFALDGKGKTWRHELYQPYKAQRTATPEPLIQQIEPLTRLVRALGLPMIVSEACEADDCIAGLADQFKSSRPVVIIGSDKDFKQCLSRDVLLWDPSGKNEKITTLETFQRETGLTPAQWADFQAVIGDSSDNIPGVPGVGPKTASTVFEKFPTLEAIRDNLAELPEKLRAKFQDHVDDMFLFRRLTTLDTKACTHVGLAEITVQPPNVDEVTAILQEFDLRSLLREFMDFVAARPDSQAAASGARPLLTARPSSAAVSGKSGPDKKTQAGQNLLQGNLLEVSAGPVGLEAEAAAIPECSLADLPDFSGAKVALLPLAQGWLLAAQDKEYRVASGQDAQAAVQAVAELVNKLGQAAQVITPDVKALLNDDEHQATAWTGLPLHLWFDLGLAAYLLDPEERDYSWPHLARQARVELGLADDNGPEAAVHASRPGLLALALADLQQGRLQGAGLDKLLRMMETPLTPVLAGMERRGLLLNIPAFNAFLKEVERELDGLTRKIYTQAGGEFNIRSAQQLGDVLFTRLGLPKVGKTKGGALSTSQEALEKLTGKHEIVDTILEYRKLEKLRSTYLAPFPRLVDKSGRIHTSFNQTATATGRLSSSNPNLQNIPVRGELGTRLRACFMAAPGKALVSADYSQIELRVLAHLSQDPMLLSAFRAGEDIHARTAGLLFDKDPAAVTPEERRNAKTINFGLIYGMGAQKLSRELRISLKEAQEFMARYFEKFTVLKGFYEGIVDLAKDQGYVTTMSGRRRLIPDIASGNSQLASQARRQAINTVVQGSAADIIKLAMLGAQASEELKNLNAVLILQIHDELVLEAPVENAKQAGLCLAAIMSGATPGNEPLLVPLTVDWGVGGNWGEAH